MLPRVLAIDPANIKTKEAKEAKSVNETKKNALSISFAVPSPFPHIEGMTAPSKSPYWVIISWI